jgi:hypothetical protein
MTLPACSKLQSSRTVAEATWGSGDAHIRSRRHASIRPAGGWGPRRFTLAFWLRLEAKSKRALGPGATVGVLGTGVPRFAYLRPRAWHLHWPGTAHLQHRPFKTLARGQALRGRQRQDLQREQLSKAGSRGAEISMQAHTLRGLDDASHDNQGRAGASRRIVAGFLFGAKEASAGAGSRGIIQRLPFLCNKTKTARTAGRRSSPSPPWRKDKKLL